MLFNSENLPDAGGFSIEKIREAEDLSFFLMLDFNRANILTISIKQESFNEKGS